MFPDEGANLAEKQRGLARWRAALDQAITAAVAVFDGNAAMESPVATLPAQKEVLPALVDDNRPLQHAGALSA